MLGKRFGSVAVAILLLAGTTLPGFAQQRITPENFLASAGAKAFKAQNFAAAVEEALEIYKRGLPAGTGRLGCLPDQARDHPYACVITRGDPADAVSQSKSAP